MSEKVETFQDVVNKNIEQLDLYTTAITRAHGDNHPEAFEVRDLFEKIHAKLQETKTYTPNLSAEFEQLRQVTNNYAIPEDVCETYVGVYHMLSELEQSYQAE